MEKNNNNSQQWIYVLVAAFFMVLLYRVFPPARMVIFSLLFVGAVVFLLYFLVQFFYQWRNNRILKNSTEGQILSKIDYCREEIARNEMEIKSIRKNIEDLQSKSNASADIIPHNREESEKLIRAFRSELELREAKLAFFRSAIKKLESLLHNHRLAQTLEEKKEQLKLLKEDHYEDIARLESLKSDVETDVFYLDTIEELSSRMLKSKSVDEAQLLKVELEEMTRELDDL